MLAYDKITWLHAEITNKCNAWCPDCLRNNNGYGLAEGLNLVSMTPNKFKVILNRLPNLKTVQLCGTYGDPIASEYIQDIIDICIERKFNLRIHTNGSLKTSSWWSNLASKIKDIDHMIIFAIDGLEDTHSIYRQGTNFNKIIKNAKSFIDNQGNAEWQLLTFEHNEHQILQCMKLSQSIGFKKFTAKKNVRIPKIAYNYLTKEEYKINPSRILKKPEIMTKNVEKEDCMHLNIPSIYMNADGSLTPCCYLRDVGYERNNIDNEILFGNPSKRCQTLCGKTIVSHKN